MKNIKKFVFLILLLAFINSCTENNYIQTNSVDDISKSYVKLAFSLNRYDSDYIDGYIGPEDLKKEALKDTLQLSQIIDYSQELLTALDDIKTSNESELSSEKRTVFLKSLLLALKTRAEIASGISYSFDEESKLIYDVISPTFSMDYYKTILNEIDSLLPGEGEINERWNNFRSTFIIPREQIDTIFKTAIAECRRRTLKHIHLPSNESFNFELVEDEPWGAYNWFKGNAKSLIQVNISLPIYIDRALDYACHEGYPGHHTYHSTHEAVLYKKNGWIEHSIVPLFSPQAVISEGLANFGIEIAFSREGKIKYEKEVLCRLAGINTKNLEIYYSVLEKKNKLKYAGIEAARRYLDGKISKAQAIIFLMNNQLRTREEAENSISFFEKYRSYIISYSIGLDLARDYFKMKNPANENEKWELYYELISKPVLPQDLVMEK